MRGRSIKQLALLTAIEEGNSREVKGECSSL